MSEKDEKIRLPDADVLLDSIRRPGWISGPDWQTIEATLTLLRAQIKNTANPSEYAHLLHECARILETELNDEETALQFTQKALAVMPDYLPAIRSARRAFSRIERWSMVCRLLEAETRHASVGSARVDTLTELSELYWSRFKRPQDALRCLGNISDSDRRGFYQPVLSQQMNRICSEATRMSAEPHGIDKQPVANKPASWSALEAFDPKFYSAVLSMDAFDQLYESEHIPAVEHIRTSTHCLDARFIRCLKEGFAAASDWVKFVELAPDTSARMSLMSSFLFGALKEGTSSADLCELAMQAMWSDSTTFGGLVATILFADAGYTERAAQAAWESYRIETNPKWIPLWLEIALVFESESGAGNDTQAEWAQDLSTLVEGDPFADWLWMCRCISALDWDGLLACLKGIHNRSEDPLVQGEALWRIGQVHEYALNNLHLARRAYRECGALLPKSRLVGWARQLELVDTYESEQANGDRSESPTDQTQWLREQLRRAATWLPMVECSEVGTSSSDHSYLADDSLWALLCAPGAGQAMPLDAVEHSYLQRRLALETTPHRKACLMRWHSRRAEESAPEDAMDSLTEAIAIDSDDPRNVFWAARFCERAGFSARAARFWLQLAEYSQESLIRSELFSRAGHLLGGGQNGQGWQLYEKALSENPNCVLARLELARRLRQPTDESTERIRLAQTLARSAIIVTEQAHFHLVAAEIARRAGQGLNQVHACLDEAIHVDENNHLAHLFKIRLGLARHQDELLAHAFSDLAIRTTHAPTASALFSGAGRAMQRSGDAFAAVSFFRRSLALDSRNYAAIYWLESWMKETGDCDVWTQLKGIIKANLLSELEVKDLYFEAGRIHRLAGIPLESAQSYLQALKLGGSSVLANHYLRRLADGQDRPREAVRFLEKAAEACADKDLAFAYFVDAGERHLALENQESGLKAWLEAFRLRPTQDSLFERARQVAELGGAWDVWLEFLNVRVFEGAENSSATELLEMVDLLVSRSDRSDQAADILRKYGKRTREMTVEARRAVADRWVELSEWMEAVKAYEEVVHGTTDPDLRRVVSLRMAAIYVDRIGDADTARIWLMNILDDDPSDADALLRLVSIAHAEGDTHQERLFLTRAIHGATDRDRKAQLRLRLAELDQMDEKPSVAVQRLERALNDMVGSPRAHEALADAYGAAQRVDEQHRALATALELTSNPADRQRIRDKLHQSTPPAGFSEDSARHESRRLAALSRALDTPLDPSVLLEFKDCLGDSESELASHVGAVRACLLHSSGGDEATDNGIETLPSSADELSRLCERLETPTLQAYQRVLNVLPSIYRSGPPDSHEEYARLPPWVLLKSEFGSVLASESFRDDLYCQYYLEIWSQTSAEFFTCWHPDDLGKIIESVAQTLGATPLELGEGDSELRHAVSARLTENPASEELMDALSLVLSQSQRLESLFVSTRAITWQHIVLRTGTLIPVLKLILRWQSQSGEGWTIWFRRDAEELVRWVLAGGMVREGTHD